MRTRFILPFLALLTGCAHDNYAVIPNGPGSSDRLSADLNECRDEVNRVYFASQHNGFGVFAPLGLLGGVLKASADAEHPPMLPNQIDPAIEACMKKHGYIGTSEN